jgi:hypothetical protein
MVQHVRIGLGRARTVAVVLALALVPAATVECKRDPVTTMPAGMVALDARHEPLRARFDATDAPRLLVLASPT